MSGDPTDPSRVLPGSINSAHFSVPSSAVRDSASLPLESLDVPRHIRDPSDPEVFVESSQSSAESARIQKAHISAPSGPPPGRPSRIAHRPDAPPPPEAFGSIPTHIKVSDANMIVGSKRKGPAPPPPEAEDSPQLQTPSKGTNYHIPYDGHNDGLKAIPYTPGIAPPHSPPLEDGTFEEHESVADGSDEEEVSASLSQKHLSDDGGDDDNEHVNVDETENNDDESPELTEDNPDTYETPSISGEMYENGEEFNAPIDSIVDETFANNTALFAKPPDAVPSLQNPPPAIFINNHFIPRGHLELRIVDVMNLSTLLPSGHTLKRQKLLPNISFEFELTTGTEHSLGSTSIFRAIDPIHGHLNGHKDGSVRLTLSQPAPSPSIELPLESLHAAPPFLHYCVVHGEKKSGWGGSSGSLLGGGAERLGEGSVNVSSLVSDGQLYKGFLEELEPGVRNDQSASNSSAVSSKKVNRRRSVIEQSFSDEVDVLSPYETPSQLISRIEALKEYEDRAALLSLLASIRQKRGLSHGVSESDLERTLSPPPFRKIYLPLRSTAQVRAGARTRREEERRRLKELRKRDLDDPTATDLTVASVGGELFTALMADAGGPPKLFVSPLSPVEQAEITAFLVLEYRFIPTTSGIVKLTLHEGRSLLAGAAGLNVRQSRAFRDFLAAHRGAYKSDKNDVDQYMKGKGKQKDEEDGRFAWEQVPGPRVLLSTPACTVLSGGSVVNIGDVFIDMKKPTISSEESPLSGEEAEARSKVLYNCTFRDEEMFVYVHSGFVSAYSRPRHLYSGYNPYLLNQYHAHLSKNAGKRPKFDPFQYIPSTIRKETRSVKNSAEFFRGLPVSDAPLALSLNTPAAFRAFGTPSWHRSFPQGPPVPLLLTVATASQVTMPRKRIANSIYREAFANRTTDFDDLRAGALLHLAQAALPLQELLLDAEEHHTVLPLNSPEAIARMHFNPQNTFLAALDDGAPRKEGSSSIMDRLSGDQGSLIASHRFFPAGELRVKIIQARGLPKADTIGSCDAYLRFSLQGRFRSFSGRTATVQDGGECPVWNETFCFDVMDHQELRLSLYDEDRFSKDDLVGEVIVDLGGVYRYGFRDAWVSLKSLGSWGKLSDVGQVHLQLDFHGPSDVFYPISFNSIGNDVGGGGNLNMGGEISAGYSGHVGPGLLGNNLGQNKKQHSYDQRERVHRRNDHAITESARENAQKAVQQIQQERQEALEQLVAGDFTDSDIRDAFAQIDLDHNLVIGAAELKHLLYSMGELVTDEEVNEMLRMCDTDGDGQIAYFEFFQMARASPADLAQPGWKPVAENTFHKMRLGDDGADGAKVDGYVAPPVIVKDEQGNVVDLIRSDVGNVKERERAMNKASELAQKRERKEKLRKLAEQIDCTLPELMRVFRKFLKTQKLPAVSAQYKAGFVSLEELGGLMACPLDSLRPAFLAFAREPVGSGSRSRAVDIKSFLLSLSGISTPDREQRARFCFFLYDNDASGELSEDEVLMILRATHLTDDESTLKKRVYTLMVQADSDNSKSICLEEFVRIAVKFPNIVFPHMSE